MTQGDSEITGSAAVVHSASNNTASFQAAWDTYWFASQPTDKVVWLQKLVSVIAALWFFGQLANGNFWWGAHGLSASELNSQLEAFTEGTTVTRFRLSPLWMSDSYGLVALWCTAGIVCAIASSLNWGGRMTRCLLALLVLGLVQRISWAVGLAEPYLVAMTFYLAFAKMSPGQDWSNGLALRLIQVHTWILLAAALASQWSYDAWREGETVWWLAASGRSNALAANWLEGRILLVNLLTHGISLATIVAVGCLWPLADLRSRLRPHCGIAAGGLLAASYALIADHALYGCLLATGVWSFSRSRCNLDASSTERG